MRVGSTLFGVVVLAVASLVVPDRLLFSFGLIAGWAERRLLDTIVGCAIAVVATYLLWPRDRETQETVPVPAT